jgi:hypothetical protein
MRAGRWVWGGLNCARAARGPTQLGVGWVQVAVGKWHFSEVALQGSGGLGAVGSAGLVRAAGASGRWSARVACRWSGGVARAFKQPKAGRQDWLEQRSARRQGLGAAARAIA